MTLLDYYRSISSICSKNLKLALYGKSSLALQNEIYTFLASNPAFVDKPVRGDKSLSEFRRESHVRTKALFDSKLMTYERMLGDINNYIEFNTCVGMYDWSCLAKFVLSWQFVGLTAHLLGTQQHDFIRADIENMNMFGSFSITELTHGSNLKGIQTTATYDPQSKCFVLNTPSVDAVKCWTGNLACTATHSLVFAQLHSKGQNHGVHMFLVPIRNPRTLLPLPGVLVGDMGEKVGLHGVDNGFMAFRNVKIPKQYLFNRLSDVADDGTFLSPQFKDNDSRLSASLGTLLMGRVAIVGISVANMRCALSIALRFSAQRRQFYLSEGSNEQKMGKDVGNEKEKDNKSSTTKVELETPVLEYATQQLRLFPNLARFFVYDRFSRQLFQHFHENFLSFVKNGPPPMEFSSPSSDGKQTSPSSPHLGRHLHVVSCGAKAVVTSCAQQVIQTCREACGGYGILASANLGKLRDDNDPQLTYEGDNYVLIQQLINHLITCYKKDGKVTLFNITLDATNDVKQLGGSGSFDTLESQQLCLNELVKFLLKMKDRNETSKLALGKAVINLIAFHWYKEWLAEVEKGKEKEFLENVLQLFTVEVLHENAAYLLSSGVLKCPKTGLHELQVKLEALCIRLKNDVIMAVDAIAPPDFILNSSIGQSEGELHENVLQDLFAASMQSKSQYSRPDWWREAVAMMGGQSNSNI